MSEREMQVPQEAEVQPLEKQSPNEYEGVCLLYFETPTIFETPKPN